MAISASSSGANGERRALIRTADSSPSMALWGLAAGAPIQLSRVAAAFLPSRL